MKRMIVKCVGGVVVAVALAASPSALLACDFLTGGGSKGGDGLASDGANVALYEWSWETDSAVLVARWFDPAAGSIPWDQDDLDLTGHFFGDGLNCFGGGGSNGPTTLPVVPAVRGPDWRGLSLLVRGSSNSLSGAPIAIGRIVGRQARVNDHTTCSGDEAAAAAACSAIRRVNPWVRSGERWTVTFADGLRRDFFVTDPMLSACAAPVPGDSCR